MSSLILCHQWTERRDWRRTGEEIREGIEEELKKRSDKIPGEDIREDIEVFQKGQIATLELMDVSSQNGNAHRATVKHSTQLWIKQQYFISGNSRQ